MVGGLGRRAGGSNPVTITLPAFSLRNNAATESVSAVILGSSTPTDSISYAPLGLFPSRTSVIDFCMYCCCFFSEFNFKCHWISFISSSNAIICFSFLSRFSSIAVMRVPFIRSFVVILSASAFCWDWISAMRWCRRASNVCGVPYFWLVCLLLFSVSAMLSVLLSSNLWVGLRMGKLLWLQSSRFPELLLDTWTCCCWSCCLGGKSHLTLFVLWREYELRDCGCVGGSPWAESLPFPVNAKNPFACFSLSRAV